MRWSWLPLTVMVGCVTPTPTPSEIAPPPFSADQIRAATPDGRTYLFAVEGPEGRALRKLTFRSPTEAGAQLEAQNLNAGDQSPLAEPQRAPVTWAELVGHASYPAAHTRIERAEITVPAGTFECRRYTVVEPSPKGQKRTVAWFADALPGAPVHHEVHIGAQLVSRMQLVEHTPAVD